MSLQTAGKQETHQHTSTPAHQLTETLNSDKNPKAQGIRSAEQSVPRQGRRGPSRHGWQLLRLCGADRIPGAEHRTKSDFQKQSVPRHGRRGPSCHGWQLLRLCSADRIPGAEHRTKSDSPEHISTELPALPQKQRPTIVSLCILRTPPNKPDTTPATTPTQEKSCTTETPT